MLIFATVDEMKAAVGQHLGYSDWVTVTQEQVNLFAEATGDYQWIHVDAEAAAKGPFGTTIAHGFLTLSLLVPLTAGIGVLDNISMGINYGLNKVRFPAPLPVGSRVRAGVTLASVEEFPGGVHSVKDVIIEREGGDKPVCVAEAVLRYYF